VLPPLFTLVTESCESRECGRVLKSLRLFLKVFSIKPEVQPAIRRGALGTRTRTSARGREAVDDIQEQLGILSPTGLAARQGLVVGEGGEASLPLITFHSLFVKQLPNFFTRAFFLYRKHRISGGKRLRDQMIVVCERGCGCYSSKFRTGCRPST